MGQHSFNYPPSMDSYTYCKYRSPCFSYIMEMPQNFQKTKLYEGSKKPGSIFWFLVNKPVGAISSFFIDLPGFLEREKGSMSYFIPAVWSRHSHTPVSGWHQSPCPLQSHRTHLEMEDVQVIKSIFQHIFRTTLIEWFIATSTGTDQYVTVRKVGRSEDRKLVSYIKVLHKEDQKCQILHNVFFERPLTMLDRFWTRVNILANSDPPEGWKK